MSNTYFVDYFGDEKSFKTKKKAIAYAQNHYLADKKGRITLISESLHDEYEDEETGEHIYEYLYHIDIPNGDGDFTNVTQFDTEKEATEYVQGAYGADKKGRIPLISGPFDD